MLIKPKFPEDCILRGKRTLHSGQDTDIFYDGEKLLTINSHVEYLFSKMPYHRHYVGIATGGASFAMGLHAWQLFAGGAGLVSFVKDKELIGERPEEDAWLLMDDVVTTGKSLRNAVEVVGSIPRHIYVMVDRREIKEKISGIDVVSIYEP